MQGPHYLFGPFRIAARTREAWRDGEPLSLPRRVFDCIVYLIEHRDRAVGRDELVSALWGRVDVADTQLSQLMRRVRHALDDDGQSQVAIRTVPGFGYHWIMPVVEDGGVPAGDIAAADARVSDTPRPIPRTINPAATESRVARWLGWVVLAGLAILLGVVGFAWLRGELSDPPEARGFAANAPQPSAAADFIVLPIDVNGPAEDIWMRLGGMEVVVERLRTAGFAVPPSESVLSTWHRSAGSDAERLAHLRDVFGARAVVRGRAVRTAQIWRVELDAVDHGGMPHHAEASHADPIHAARAAADQLIASFGRTPPQALEGDPFDERVRRARSAILANELDTARAILGTGADDDSAEMRYWRASLDFRSGQFRKAADAFTALLADPAVAQNEVLRGRVLIGRAGSHIRLAEYAAGRDDFDAAADALREHANLPEFGEALAGRAITNIALHDFDAGASDLGRARMQLERAGDPFGIARVEANRGLLELERGNPAAAIPYLETAARRFEAFGAVSPLLSTLNALFDAHTFLLQWNEALAISERRLALRERAAEAMQRFLIGMDRGRVMAALGRLREADALYAQTAAAFPDIQIPLRRVLQMHRAELASQRGNANAAWTLSRDALALAPCAAADRTCAQLALVYQRNLPTDALPADAGGAPGVLALEGPEDASTAPILAVARAEWAALHDRNEDAEREFRAALGAVDAGNMPSRTTLVAASYTHWLLGQRRLEEASAVAGRLAPWAERDYDCAISQLAVLHGYAEAEPWAAALRRAKSLAGEREVPEALTRLPASAMTLRP